MTLEFSRLGKATDNTFVETLNGRFRSRMNVHWHLSLADDRTKIDGRRRDYSESGPYTSLDR
ncbi:integrase core domain-containing protein [Sphingomonas phyllosphaerae]|uniref:integrase core domain-containing protein n=1 Tax=Sphingomonas phyllosphaerae TaxID=257003 RepID=UPI0004105ECC